MPEKKEKTNRRRTQVKDLPKDEKELSREEQKEVKGGLGAPGNFGDTPGLNGGDMVSKMASM
ncbi:MAG TPA: hypothetical protein VGB73_19340 [Pyrinomonadaceae bacterium]|jgi:hypothetical protein